MKTKLNIKYLNIEHKDLTKNKRKSQQACLGFRPVC